MGRIDWIPKRSWDIQIAGTMLSCFPFRFSGKSAGKLPFKICDVDRKEKIGICVRSIDDLKIKISNKFEVGKHVLGENTSYIYS